MQAAGPLTAPPIGSPSIAWENFSVLPRFTPKWDLLGFQGLMDKFSTFDIIHFSIGMFAVASLFSLALTADGSIFNANKIEGVKGKKKNKRYAAEYAVKLTVPLFISLLVLYAAVDNLYAPVTSLVADNTLRNFFNDVYPQISTIMKTALQYTQAGASKIAELANNYAVEGLHIKQNAVKFATQQTGELINMAYTYTTAISKQIVSNIIYMSAAVESAADIQNMSIERVLRMLAYTAFAAAGSFLIFATHGFFTILPKDEGEVQQDTSSSITPSKVYYVMSFKQVDGGEKMNDIYKQNEKEEEKNYKKLTEKDYAVDAKKIATLTSQSSEEDSIKNKVSNSQSTDRFMDAWLNKGNTLFLEEEEDEVYAYLLKALAGLVLLYGDKAMNDDIHKLFKDIITLDIKNNNNDQFDELYTEFLMGKTDKKKNNLVMNENNNNNNKDNNEEVEEKKEMSATNIQEDYHDDYKKVMENLKKYQAAFNNLPMVKDVYNNIASEQTHHDVQNDAQSTVLETNNNNDMNGGKNSSLPPFFSELSEEKIKEMLSNDKLDDLLSEEKIDEMLAELTDCLKRPPGSDKEKPTQETDDLIDNTLLDNTLLDNTLLDNTLLDNTLLDNTLLDNTLLDNTLLDNTLLDNTLLDNTLVDNTLLDITKEQNIVDEKEEEKDSNLVISDLSDKIIAIDESEKHMQNEQMQSKHMQNDITEEEKKKNLLTEKESIEGDVSEVKENSIASDVYESNYDGGEYFTDIYDTEEEEVEEGEVEEGGVEEEEEVYDDAPEVLKDEIIPIVTNNNKHVGMYEQVNELQNNNNNYVYNTVDVQNTNDKNNELSQSEESSMEVESVNENEKHMEEEIPDRKNEDKQNLRVGGVRRNTIEENGVKAPAAA